MNPFRVLYWSYFTFYRSVMKDDTPHLLTTLAVGTSEAMLIIAISDYVMAKFSCHSISKPAMFLILGVALLLNYWYFHRLGHALKIVQERPQRARSVHLLSAAFFIVSLVAFFEMPGVVHDLIKRCS